jgi:hypothetical protein
MSDQLDEFKYYMASANGGYELTPDAIAEGKQSIRLLFSSQSKKVPLFSRTGGAASPDYKYAAEKPSPGPSKALHLLGRGEKRAFQASNQRLLENTSATPSNTVESSNQHSQHVLTSGLGWREINDQKFLQAKSKTGGFVAMTSPTQHLQPSLLLSRNSGLFPVSELSEGDYREHLSGSKTSAHKQTGKVQYESDLDQFKVDHMKQVMDKIYGPTLDPAIEYPNSLSSAPLFRDILLEAEKAQAQQLLFTQQKRRLNIMKKLAEDLEKDLVKDAQRVDTFTEDIEKEIKELETKSKKKALEILSEEIDEQVQADQLRIAQLEKLEAEMELSKLIRQNEEVIGLAESDLARGLKTKDQKMPVITIKKSQNTVGKKVSQLSKPKKAIASRKA